MRHGFNGNGDPAVTRHRVLSAKVFRSTFAWLERLSGARLTVLIFHRVLPEHDPLNPGTPDATEFERLMRLVGRSFNIVSLADAVASLRADRLPPRATAITFDDGYADNATIAAPILQRLGMPATFFIASGFLDGGRMFNDTVIEAVRRWEGETMDLSSLGLGAHPMRTLVERIAAMDAVLAQARYLAPVRRDEVVRAIESLTKHTMPANLMMTRKQLRALADQDMTIGAHTVNHPILASISDMDAEKEIRDSKAELEAITGRTVTLFAYPNGKPRIDYTRTHVEIVKQAGYAGAFSTAIGAARIDSDPYQIPRFTPWRRKPLSFRLQLAQNLFRSQYARAT